MADVLIASASNSGCQEVTEVANGRTQILGGQKRNGVVACSLKRKRPLAIEIPNVLRDISSDILRPRAGLGQGEGSVCFADKGVGVFSVKGKKKFMEDAHMIFFSADGNKAFFGVYDGHGGSKAAEFVTENLHLKILEMLKNSSESEERREAVREGYLKTDEEFLKQGLSSGVCCLTTLIEGQEIVISNLGDCRADLCKDGVGESITTDHTPGLDDERRRIEEKGGYVEFHRGAWRVHGTLAVSRSIGDAHLKDWVIAEPDTRVLRLTPDMDYLVLASDGLWHEVSDQEAADVVTHACSSGRKGPSPLTPAMKGSAPSSPRSPLVVSQNRSIQKTCTPHPRLSRECCENASPSPPAKSRRISMANRTKRRGRPSNDENDGPTIERSSHEGLLGACERLVNLAVCRGSLDDITVMVVDLRCRNGGS